MPTKAQLQMKIDIYERIFTFLGAHYGQAALAKRARNYAARWIREGRVPDQKEVRHDWTGH